MGLRETLAEQLGEREGHGVYSIVKSRKWVYLEKKVGNAHAVYLIFPG